MDDIVEQTETIVNSFVALTLQVPSAFPSPSQNVVDRIRQFNESVFFIGSDVDSSNPGLQATWSGQAVRDARHCDEPKHPSSSPGLTAGL
jgi:hypothetical protein